MHSLVSKWGCLVVLGSVVGCTGGSTGDAGEVGGTSTDESGDGANGASTETGMQTDGGSTGGASADESGDDLDDADGTGADGDTEDDSGSDPDGRLFPVEAGRVWTYDVSTFGGFPVCAPGTHDEAAGDAMVVGGREAFEVTSFCPAAGTSVISVDGDVVDLYYQGGWIRTLDTPVEEGHSWTSTGAIQYVWRDEGSVTVPAGQFEDCWRREQVVNYSAYTIFCRGVGAVRHYSMDLAGAGWDAVLTDTSF